MSYTPLSIHNGYGNVHINRFRVSLRPTLSRVQIAQLGARLQAGLLLYMAAATASVKYGDHNWNNHRTLKFRGVTRLRPFKIWAPVVPIVGVKIPVPAFIRDWMAPDVHTDSVGVVGTQPTGFTVQTLQRDYEDGDDRNIRIAVTAASAASPPLIPLGQAMADMAVELNQKHFLAGRRAFRIDSGKAFGYADDRIVFETVAIERFTNELFAKSMIVMGNIETLIRDVWVGMLTQFCQVNRLTPIVEAAAHGWKKSGQIHYVQAETKPLVTSIKAHAQFATMAALNKNILESRPKK